MDEKEQFTKEKELFITYVKDQNDALDKQRKDVVAMQKATIVQDSINRIKTVIKADHVIANTINTVNAKTVIKK